MSDKPRFVIERKVDTPSCKPRLFSTRGKKELKSRDKVRTRRYNLFGNTCAVPVLIAVTWKLFEGHYLLVENNEIFEMFVNDRGEINLYAPDFTPPWLVQILGEEVKSEGNVSRMSQNLKWAFWSFLGLLFKREY